MNNKNRVDFLRRPSSRNRAQPTAYLSLTVRGGSRIVSPRVFSRFDDWQQHLACMGNKRSPSVCSCFNQFGPSFCVKYLNDRVYPFLGDFSRCPNIDMGVVKTLGEYGVVEV